MLILPPKKDVIGAISFSNEQFGRHRIRLTVCFCGFIVYL